MNVNWFSLATDPSLFKDIPNLQETCKPLWSVDHSTIRCFSHSQGDLRGSVYFFQLPYHGYCFLSLRNTFHLIGSIQIWSLNVKMLLSNPRRFLSTTTRPKTSDGASVQNHICVMLPILSTSMVVAGAEGKNLGPRRID